MYRFVVALSALPAGQVPAHAATAQGTNQPSIVTASRLDGPIKLDGRLDEPAWATVASISDLVQQSPHPGEATPYRTEVRFLVDGETLYLGFKAFDPDPERIAVHTMQRDGDMGGDDTMAFVLDTFGDSRSGYLFRINVAGARQDGLISGSQDVSLDWDGIWDARACRLTDGWSGEIAIPAQTLRFTKGLNAWGMNVERYVARDQMTLRWAGASLDVSIYDLSQAGQLEGMEELRQGLGLSVVPYGLSRWAKEADASSGTLQGDGGLDVTYHFTSQLASVLTVNTDFAETEVDTQQINLTRFDLFFPEKRAFFLEGSNQYQFALGLGQDFIPFYSRRVGLGEANDGTVQVPIDVGLKLLGRTGNWGIAALGTRMGESTATPATSLFAGRLTYDVDQHLRFGTLVTLGAPDGVSDNALAGIDTVWHTSTFLGDKNFTGSLWGAKSAGDAPGAHVNGERRTGWGFKVDYPNDRWEVSAQASEFGEALNPALGFLPRPGIRKYDAGVAFQPRPDGGPFSWVRQFFFELFAHRVDSIAAAPASLPASSPDCATESWRVFTAPFNIETQTGEHLEANWQSQFECLREPFEIVPGVMIPAGEYRFPRFRVEGQSSPHRAWSGGSTLWFGGFYDGHLSQLEQFVSWTSHGGHLYLRLDRESDTGHLPGGRVAQRLWQGSTVYAITSYLVISTYGQYDADSLGINSRLRWTIHPGTDVFVVWNRNWRDSQIPNNGRSDFLPLDSDQVVVKLRWALAR